MALPAIKTETRIARPLRVLVPLIKKDLLTAQAAGLPYYRAAGEKLLEARSQMKHGEFTPWGQQHFKVKPEQLRYYMSLAEHAAQTNGVPPFSSLSDFIRKTTNPNYNLPANARPASWQEPVKQIVTQVDTETLNLARAELKRGEERDAQRKLALQLIDIGYKVLARELHPDRGGSREAMSRLNRVRDRLKQFA